MRDESIVAFIVRDYFIKAGACIKAGNKYPESLVQFLNRHFPGEREKMLYGVEISKRHYDEMYKSGAFEVKPYPLDGKNGARLV